jgi:hydrogenase maturation protein HypF
VAGALGICFDCQAYEGEAAMRLETLARSASADDTAYPFACSVSVPIDLDPAPLWQALVADIGTGVPVAVIAARFHRGLAKAVAETAARLCFGVED